MLAPAGAQTSTMRFDIPFAFVAGDQVLPAGTYRVTVDDTFDMCRFNLIGETSTHVVRMVPGATDRALSKAADGSMKFTRYDDRYFLTGVWKTGSVAGNEIVQSHRQRESAKAGTAPAVVSVNSN